MYVTSHLEDTKMLSLGYGLSKDDTGLAEIFVVVPFPPFAVPDGLAVAPAAAAPPPPPPP